MAELDLYATLGLPRTATDTEVRAMQGHAAKGGGPDSPHRAGWQQRAAAATG
jgi:curved DNA-binding protein CbpA